MPSDVKFLFFGEGFLEKNRDAVSFDIIKTVDMSSNKLLRQIFESELSTNGVKMANNKKVIMTPKSSLRVRTHNLIGKLCCLFLLVHTEDLILKCDSRFISCLVSAVLAGPG